MDKKTCEAWARMTVKESPRGIAVNLLKSLSEKENIEIDIETRSKYFYREYHVINMNVWADCSQEDLCRLLEKFFKDGKPSVKANDVLVYGEGKEPIPFTCNNFWPEEFPWPF